MLRQKFMVVLGVIVTLHVVMALLSIYVLHGVLRDLEQAGAAALEATAAIQRVRTEVDALAARPGENTPMRASLEQHLRSLSDCELMKQPQAAILISGLRDGLSHGQYAYHPTVRGIIDQLDSYTSELVDRRRDEITAKFRMSAIALGIVFVVVINATVMVLSRMVSMIVKPVDTLVEASRRLAREEFDHRVELDRQDEFGELGAAYNALAEQLQSNEQRKIETLHQVARTLSHELNNAIAIIELQLALIGRSSAGDGAQAGRLREIHHTLGRINRTIDALTQVRRIVLTDYTPGGARMLDLEQSLEDAPSTALPAELDGRSREYDDEGKPSAA